MTDYSHCYYTFDATPPETIIRFWECYVEETDGGNHYRHWTLESAKQEAERLARLTNKTVYVFECVGKCKVELNPVRWEYPRE